MDSLPEIETFHPETFHPKVLKPVPGGVTAPRGILAGGTHCGIRKERKDLAIVYSQVPAQAAGMFTANRVKAAPVLLSRERVRGGVLRAVVINSGNANACTGQRGMADAETMAALAAAALGISNEHVAVASTGVIGVPLPMDCLAGGIPALVGSLSAAGGEEAAEAIMTTDTFPKQVAVRVNLDGRWATIGGMAKGSGMIHPNMATMLGFLTTDAAVPTPLLQDCLRAAVERSFNMITVDGDTSTNDMVLALANGLAGNRPLEPGTAALAAFREALEYACIDLARAIARDGEGATKLLEVTVAGARAVEDARLAARAVAGSALVKAALFGADPNWGRVMAALGYSGAEFDPDEVTLHIGPLKVAEAGCAVPFSERRAAAILAKREVRLTVILGDGPGKATAWGCDLSYDYVKINGQYRT